ncbi:MAG: hypothetical protein K2Y12_14100 [Chitinophagaceae bacterium]|nr:hypothetical protein [Chitinophagaceae bacterium]
MLKKNARTGLKVREAIEYLRLRTDPQAEVTITGYLVGSRQLGKDIFLQLAEDKGQIASAFNCYCRFELNQQPALQSIAQNTAITVSGKLGETTQGITLTDCQLIMINNEGKDMYLPVNY